MAGSYQRTPEHRALMAELNRGKNLGNTHGCNQSAETRAKKSQWMKANQALIQSPEIRAQRSARMKGNKNLLGRKHSDETKARMTDARLGNKYALGNRMTDEWKRTRSEMVRNSLRYAPFRAARALSSDKARRNGMKAMESLNRKRIEYLDRRGRLWRFRSGYELRYANLLDSESLTWSYEPDRLLLSDGRVYVPDFWVVEWNAYVEVKGWRGWRMDKVDLARRDGHLVYLVGRSTVGSA